ncbi:hypothetical protein AOLI_G00157800 [Acnodon oligacanthus]
MCSLWPVIHAYRQSQDKSVTGGVYVCVCSRRLQIEEERCKWRKQKLTSCRFTEDSLLLMACRVNEERRTSGPERDELLALISGLLNKHEEVAAWRQEDFSG